MSMISAKTIAIFRPEFPTHLLLNNDTHLVLIHDRRCCFAFARILNSALITIAAW